LTERVALSELHLAPTTKLNAPQQPVDVEKGCLQEFIASSNFIPSDSLDELFR
jgi:hypothetical protein